MAATPDLRSNHADTRRGLIAKRVAVGADSPIGRRLSALIGLLEIEPADDRHASRRLALMGRASAEIETIIAAERGGAA